MFQSISIRYLAGIGTRLLIVGFVVVSTGCAPATGGLLASSTDVSLPPQLKAFPQQAPVEGERARMSALAWGQITLIDECLRLTNPYNVEDTGHLIIWPADHEARDESGVLVIYDGAGQRVGQVGDKVFMGGGEDDRIEPITETVFGLQEATPAECPGPYWVMGNIEPNKWPTPAP